MGFMLIKYIKRFKFDCFGWLLGGGFCAVIPVQVDEVLSLGNGWAQLNIDVQRGWVASIYKTVINPS